MDKPLLHLVFGGEVTDPQGTDFVDIDNLEVVGFFPNHQAALQAWRGASQARRPSGGRGCVRRRAADVVGRLQR